MKTGKFTPLIAALLLMLAGCDDNPNVSVITPSGPGGASTITAIAVTPIGPLSLSVADTQQLTAVATDASGTSVLGLTFSWASTDATVASVSSLGLVTGLTPGGPVSITATSGALSSNPVDVTVDCNGVPSVISSLTSAPVSVSTQGTSAISLTVDDCDVVTLPDVPDGTPVNFTVTPASIGSVTPQVNTASGVAGATFTAGTASGIATITATVGGLISSVNVTITPANIGSIQFGSASPQVIGIQGSGKTENSVITFLVKDDTILPAPDGIPVLFTLLGPQGISTSTPLLSTVESLKFYAVSTTGGSATTTLLSGAVAGTAKIIACVDVNASGTCDAGDISSSSTPLSIGGGVPSMTHFSVPRTIINLAGLSYVNEQTTVSAFIGDRFGNFNVLEGTSVSFFTEAGAIDTNGVTDSTGTTSVILRTQNPSPIDVDPRDPLNPLGSVAVGETYVDGNCNGFTGGEAFEDANDNLLHDVAPCEHYTDIDGSGYDLTERNPRDGWVSILAFTKGEETFSDLNGNGLYDPLPLPGEPKIDNGGEPFIDSNDNGIYDGTETFSDLNFNGTYESTEPFTDIDRPEPFLDSNGSGGQDGTEPFTDLNGNGVWDATGFGNGIYDPGELFVDINGDGQWTHGNGVWDSDTTIWTTTTLVFTSGPVIGPFNSRIVINNADMDPGDPSQFFILNGGCASFNIFVSDINANALTPESTVTIEASAGKLFGGGTFVIADGLSDGPLEFSVQICDEDAATIEPVAGSLTVKGLWKAQFGEVEYEIGTVFGSLDN